MSWSGLYPKDKEPSFDEIAGYIGKVKNSWLSLISWFETSYKTKPKMTYSGCSGMPGWNIKFQKSGVGFGTWYPQKNFLLVMVIMVTVT